MHAILALIIMVLDFYKWIVIGSVIMSWLVSFNIINYSSPFVKMIYDFLYQMTEPVFAFVRRFLPSLNGIDLSPIVVIFAIHFLIIFVAQDVAPMLLGK